MKKILHIVGYYHPAIGGIEDVANSVVSATNDICENKIICYNQDSSKTFSEIYKGVEVTRIGVFAKLFKRQPITFSYFINFKRILNSFSPDIIHFHSPNPLPAIYILLLRLQGIKLIIHWHANVPGRLLKLIFEPLNYLLLSKSDTIIVATPYHIRGVKSLMKYEQKLKIIPFAIQESKFQINNSIEKKIKLIINQYNNKKIVFFVGRHVYYKGIAHLIEATDYLKNDCVVVIAGSGRLTEKLKASAKSDKIHFIGRISDEDLVAYLHASDVFAFPSINYAEAFGIALAEALYCSLPAVTFTIPSSSGVNWVSPNNETGLEVENSNSIEFAKAIDKLLSNKELNLKFGQQAHTHVVNNLSSKKFEENIKKIYFQ
ncbi:MAG: glycosyltransferase [Flavobacteriaceae bacterium]